MVPTKLYIIWPLATTMSSSPSRSKSAATVPNPTKRPPNAVMFGSFARVHKKAVSFVAIEAKRLPLVVGDPDIGQPIQVVVKHRNAHGAVGDPVFVYGCATQKADLLQLSLGRRSHTESCPWCRSRRTRPRPRHCRCRPLRPPGSCRRDRGPPPDWRRETCRRRC